jgi:hypothetical protein
VRPIPAVATGVRLSPPKPAPKPADAKGNGEGTAKGDGKGAAGDAASVTHTVGGVALEFEYTSKDVLGEGREVADVITVRAAPRGVCV